MSRAEEFDLEGALDNLLEDWPAVGTPHGATETETSDKEDEPEPNEHPPLVETIQADVDHQAADDSPAAIRHYDEATIFDIETGPRSWPEIEELYEAPQVKLGEFNPESVRYGRMTDPRKKAEKLKECRQRHEEAAAAEQAKIATAKDDFLADCALYPETGQVLAIGMVQPGRDPIVMGSQGTESDLLNDFWRHFLYCLNKHPAVPMVGFNIYEFDLPFLVVRSRFHGIRVPEEVILDPRQRNPWNRLFIDLREWHLVGRRYQGTRTVGQQKLRMGLDDLARFYHVTRKSGNGAGFHLLWNGGTEAHGRAIAYLKRDLQVTMEVAEKLGVVAVRAN